jgi:GT2 family glycosyltransferase
MTSIIIPVADNEDYTRQCLDSIKRNTKDYEIIIIDNGSKKCFIPDNDWIDVSSFGSDNKTHFVSNKEGIGSLTIIRNKENLGFPKAINQGIIESTGEFICILNNDTVVTYNWLEHLTWHLDNGLDIVGPVTNCASGIQQITIDAYNDENELNEAAKKFYESKKHRAVHCSRLVGFCLLFKKIIVDKIGFLDQGFGLGNYEDDDFILRAVKNGYRVGIGLDTYIHHFGGVTHKSLGLDYEKLLETNKKYFDEKWKGDK